MMASLQMFPILLLPSTKPNLTKIPFTSFPSELREMILNSIDMGNKQILQVNRELRKHALRYGLFPRKVDRIELHLAIHQQYAMPALSVSVSHQTFNLYFTFCDIDNFGDGLYRTYMGKLSDFRLINLIRLCEEVCIRMYRGGIDATLLATTYAPNLADSFALRSLFENVGFLLNVKSISRFVVSTNLRCHPYLRVTLDAFKAMVTTCHTWDYDNMSFFPSEKEELREYYLQSIQRTQFINCPIYISGDFEKDFSLITKTNAELIVSTVYNLQKHFLSVTEFLLRNGIPSRHPNPAIVIYSCNIGSKQPKQLRTHLMDRLIELGGAVKIGPKTREAEQLLFYFTNLRQRGLTTIRQYNKISNDLPVLDRTLHRRHFLKGDLPNGKYFVALSATTIAGTVAGSRRKEKHDPILLMRAFDR